MRLEELGYKSMIMRKGSRGRKLTKREKQGNGTKAKVRARVEHVFGAQANDMGGTMLPARLHALARNDPRGRLDVDFLPLRASDFGTSADV